MTTIAKNITVPVTILALLLLGISPAIRAGEAARLEGLLIGGDGRPAQGHVVHLIDVAGEAVAVSTTTGEGLYSFKDVAPGEYGLGIESPDGLMAAVAAPPLELAPGELARRDLKLVEADEDAIQAAIVGNPNIGMAYASWSKAGKIWFWVAIVVGIGVAIAVLDDEDSSSP